MRPLIARHTPVCARNHRCLANRFLFKKLLCTAGFMDFGMIFVFSTADRLAPFQRRKREKRPKDIAAAMRGSVRLWYSTRQRWPRIQIIAKTSGNQMEVEVGDRLIGGLATGV